MTIRFEIGDAESALEDLVAVKETLGTILARSRDSLFSPSLPVCVCVRERERERENFTGDG